ncbi:ABC transporter ATP-binding protein [Candidatus Thiothrix sp. Deng01]|uniref:ABC transporter ATP-binding protein n=1 Tax=Candidatus Thiothrix phosphatis TaxID=3112415 RepID=A0ABU6CWH9_9GAMM|nr:ABC transporter ATP-binding protein [Candidatus Thiothrix sp. Deng01]MEB4591174.1 ABC transporter ATP-binding protein [Candidatus Thiothrix sp. Deng01]
MSSDFAIKVTNVGKNYQIYDRPHHRLLQMLPGNRRQWFRDFWALQDVSFSIGKGETVGIIGRNGSGKSTLLQMICGTLTPTTGSIEVNGRVAALLELGAGFNPEFTGRENVYMAASLYGLSKEETNAKMADIIAFADIAAFMEQPVKTYSSGMYVRLAFAVIAHVDADILVVDEALAVGDAFFTQKCIRFLRDFMQTGTVLFVSHDTAAIVNLCSKAVLLSQGKIAETGTPKEVTEHYLATLYAADQDVTGVSRKQDGQEEASEALADVKPDAAGFGTGDAKILGVRLLGQDGEPLTYVMGGEDVMLDIRCAVYRDIVGPIIGFQFKDRLGQVIFSDNTFLAYRDDPQQVAAGTELTARFEFQLPFLPSGDYSISPAIAEGTQEAHIQHHWLHDAMIVRVHAASACMGLIGVPMKRVSLRQATDRKS